jgi:hypothetical protein
MMTREERDRRDHIRRWAVLMIMHLEGREEPMPYYTFEQALGRLRELIDREVPRESDATDRRTA